MRNINKILLILVIFLISCVACNKMQKEKYYMKVDSTKIDTQSSKPTMTKKQETKKYLPTIKYSKKLNEDLSENKATSYKSNDTATEIKDTIIQEPKKSIPIEFHLNNKKLTIEETPMTNEQIADDQINRIGKVTHLIKDTMVYNITDTVELIVSYNHPSKEILSQVKTFQYQPTENITTHSIRITPEMRARLIDPTKKNFIIVPLTDSIQIIEMRDSTFTIWQWCVTPLKGGQSQLILSLDIIVNDHTKSIETYQDKIYVYISIWSRIWYWIELNWEYISFIIIGIFGILGWYYKKEDIINFFKKR